MIWMWYFPVFQEFVSVFVSAGGKNPGFECTEQLAILFLKFEVILTVTGTLFVPLYKARAGFLKLQVARVSW